jgi:hypothetical protein
MIQDDEDTLLFWEDASDASLCLDEDHGPTSQGGQGVPWPNLGTQSDKEELDDTLLMDDGLEVSGTTDLEQVAHVDFLPLDDPHLGSGFDSDLDHLDLFEDQSLASGALREDGIEDHMSISDSEDISIEDDDQNDDRYREFTALNSHTY